MNKPRIHRLFNSIANGIASCAFFITGWMLALSIGVEATAAEPVTESFTDSSGRTILYRYSLKDDWDPKQPRGLLVFFHGNNTGSQQDILNGFFPSTEFTAWSRGLIPVVPVSPRATTRPYSDFTAKHYSGDGVREWYHQDIRLVHELLQSEFNDSVSVDFNRIIFEGGSQGICFLTQFLREYAEFYGGGFLARCGCDYGGRHDWAPSQDLKDRFKVFVQATTEDYLWEQALQIYGYYKYSLGIETLGDLTHPGEHCSSGSVSRSQAIDWLLDRDDLEDRIPADIWFGRRVSAMDRVLALTVDSGGAIWVVREGRSESSRAEYLLRSVDSGETWETVSRLDSLFPAPPPDEYPARIVHDIDAVGEVIFLGTRHGVYQSKDGGIQFSLLNSDLVGQMVADRSSRLYIQSRDAADLPIFSSSDLGQTWVEVSRNKGWMNPETIRVADASRLVTKDFLGPTETEEWTEITYPFEPTGEFPVWDGDALWRGARVRESNPDFPGSYTLNFKLYRTSNDIGNWIEVAIPAYLGSKGRLSVLGNRQVMSHGDRLVGHVTLNQGQDWSRVLNLPYLQALSMHPNANQVVATLPTSVLGWSTGVFLLERPPELTNSAISAIGSSDVASDTDADGVVDANDAFPNDPTEFLDTDRDGVGNRADIDDDGDGVIDSIDAMPLDQFESLDTDGDGIGNNSDFDDDSDWVDDFLDAFPLNRLEWRDSDGDKVGDNEDTDDDGDGVDDFRDSFPFDSSESSDTDADGVGNRLDADDDNDGIFDSDDSHPLTGPALDRLSFVDIGDKQRLYDFEFGLHNRNGIPLANRSLGLSAFRRPHPISVMAGIQPGPYSYPEAEGNYQGYGTFTLNIDHGWKFEFMIDYDSIGHIGTLYLDLDRNGNLTDDGHPLALVWGTYSRAVLYLSYPSGEVLPYVVAVRPLHTAVQYHGSGARFTGRVSSLEIGIAFEPLGVRIGEVTVPGGPVFVGTHDSDVNGVFSSSGDSVCIDLDRDLRCSWGSEVISVGDTFSLDGSRFRAVVDEGGHIVEFKAVETDEGA